MLEIFNVLRLSHRRVRSNQLYIIRSIFLILLIITNVSFTRQSIMCVSGRVSLN
jgi:hypothetical protein